MFVDMSVGWGFRGLKVGEFCLFRSGLFFRKSGSLTGVLK